MALRTRIPGEKKRGRPRRVEASPEECLQAYWWRRDGHLNHMIALWLGVWPRVRDGEDGYLGAIGERTLTDERGARGISVSLGQIWHRTVLRYIRDGERLWESGEWAIVGEITIQTGVRVPETGREDRDRPVVHRVFARRGRG